MQKHHYEFNKNSESLTLSEAVKAILESDIDDITDVASIENPDYSKLLEEFETFKNIQKQFNMKLLERFYVTNKKIRHLKARKLHRKC